MVFFLLVRLMNYVLGSFFYFPGINDLGNFSLAGGGQLILPIVTPVVCQGCVLLLAVPCIHLKPRGQLMRNVPFYSEETAEISHICLGAGPSNVANFSIIIMLHASQTPCTDWNEIHCPCEVHETVKRSPSPAWVNCCVLGSAHQN